VINLEEQGLAMRVGGKGGLKPPHWGGLDPHRGIYRFFIRDYDEGRGESLIIDKTVAQFMHVTFVNRNVNPINTCRLTHY